MNVGVILSGGGAKGAFEAGFIKGILRKVDEFTIAYGSSTGSLISTCIGLNEFDLMERIYTGVETDNILEPNILDDIAVLGDIFSTPDIPIEVLLGYAVLFKKSSLYSIDPLKKIIDNFVDFNELKASSVDVGYLTTNIDTLKSVFFSAKKTSPKNLRSALLASVSMPVFMSPVKIGRKGRFVDGGLSRHLPGLESLSSPNYDKTDVFIFVSTLPLNFYPDNKVSDNIFDILIATIFGLSDWNDRNSLCNEISVVRDKLKKDGKKLYVIQPDNLLPIKNSLHFDPKEMKELFKLGMKAARSVNKLL